MCTGGSSATVSSDHLAAATQRPPAWAQLQIERDNAGRPTVEVDSQEQPDWPVGESEWPSR